MIWPRTLTVQAHPGGTRSGGGRRLAGSTQSAARQVNPGLAAGYLP
jgi:hypothetical protein